MKTAKFYLIPLGISFLLMMQGCFTMLPTKQVHYDYPGTEESVDSPPGGQYYPPDPGCMCYDPTEPPSPPPPDPPGSYQPSQTVNRTPETGKAPESGRTPGGSTTIRDNGNGRSPNRERRSR